MKQTAYTATDLQRIVTVINRQDLPLQVEFRPYKSKRSVEQNRLYWKWLDMVRIHIADSGGELFTAEELHEWYKAKFLKSRVVEVAGEAIRCRATTTKLNVAEMTEYLESIDRHAAASLNLILPREES